jgi:bifunctional non-homologous end joining protein LigD
MRATTAEAPLDSAGLAYEPKYDGIRALVALEPGRGGPRVRFWSRLGNEKTAQFPEIADALRVWGRGLRRPLLLDGEIVALDLRGEPAGFQRLQGRMHLKGAGEGAATPSRPGHDAALFLFDLLRDGDVDLRPLPYRERRRRLERLFAEKPAGPIRISEQAVGDGRDMQARALSRGWEGLLAKHLDSTYKSGRRSTDWRKLKLVRTQSCVVGGWTDPRGSRPHLGALILGVYDERQRLQYVGHAGSGFTDAELERVWTRLRPLQTAESPFAVRPPVNERPHWVKPLLVAEVKFTEWTTDGVLRHPTYLGLRDDIDPARVRREPDVPTDRMQASRPTRAPGRRRSEVRRAEPAERTSPTAAETAALLAQLDAIAARGGSGVLALPGGDRLDVTNLGKVFWPRARLTKGDLLRHYVRVAPLISGTRTASTGSPSTSTGRRTRSRPGSERRRSRTRVRRGNI